MFATNITVIDYTTFILIETNTDTTLMFKSMFKKCKYKYEVHQSTFLQMVAPEYAWSLILHPGQWQPLFSCFNVQQLLKFSIMLQT